MLDQNSAVWNEFGVGDGYWKQVSKVKGLEDRVPRGVQRGLSLPVASLRSKNTSLTCAGKLPPALQTLSYLHRTGGASGVGITISLFYR